jgi:hypothetical protein
MSFGKAEPYRTEGGKAADEWIILGIVSAQDNRYSGAVHRSVTFKPPSCYSLWHASTGLEDADLP